MKALLINGSPRADGCVARALKEVAVTLEGEGIAAEIVNISTKDIRGCISCGYCDKNGKCVFDDIVNQTAEKFKEADALIVGTPVYYGSPNGSILSFMDRLFFSAPFSKQMKVGAAVVSARRGGNTSAFDVMNKYFTISGMPVASSTYWNMVYGFSKEDVEKDKEGLQTMRNLGRNVAFLIKAINAEKQKSGLPEVERGEHTSFPDGK